MMWTEEINSDFMRANRLRKAGTKNICTSRCRIQTTKWTEKRKKLKNAMQMFD